MASDARAQKTLSMTHRITSSGICRRGSVRSITFWFMSLLPLCLLPAVLAQASPLRVDQLVRAAQQLDQDIADGGELFAEHCARCHGKQALGDPAKAIPALAAQRQAYLIKQLADFSELQRSSRTMHAIVAQPELAEPQVWADIAGYLNGLQPASPTQTGDGSGVQLGEAIFREQCASCHEEDGRGDDDGFIPSLRNQHYAYLMQQMRGLASWHRLNVDAELVRYLDSLELDELSGVADYLSRMTGPVRDRSRLHDDGTVGD